MSLDFGKLDYSVSLNRTSAFPLDAKSYFESLEEALTAAATAEEAGSKNTAYYFGQTVAVVQNNHVDLYTIGTDKTLNRLVTGANSFYVGYYHNSLFYDDSTYLITLPKKVEALYYDLTTNRFYNYNSQSGQYVKQVVQDIPEATSSTAGIMKLYQEHGTDTAGTMSQAKITDSIDKIKFVVEQDPEQQTENMLVLNKPW